MKSPIRSTSDMNYHVVLMDIITGTPFAEPAHTFNDLPLPKQFALHEKYAQEADIYRRTTSNPEAPVFLIAPEYTYSAHPRDENGDVTHRFLQNDIKKHVQVLQLNSNAVILL